MSERDIFVSVGAPANDQQEKFLRALEDRLRAEGLVPHTIGRNHYTADAPLTAVLKLMEQCSGAVILALERDYYPNGIEKRGGPNQKPTEGIRLPTPWNHVEAAIAYTKGRPLLVIVESGLRQNGLLERGYDWYVQTVMLEAGALATPEFNGVLADWKLKLHQKPTAQSTAISTSDLTVSQLIGGLKPTQLWAALTTVAAVIAGAFALGAKLFP